MIKANISNRGSSRRDTSQRYFGISECAQIKAIDFIELNEISSKRTTINEQTLSDWTDIIRIDFRGRFISRLSVTVEKKNNAAMQNSSKNCIEMSPVTSSG